MQLRAQPTEQASTTARAVVESIFRYKSRFLAAFVTVIVLTVLYALVAPRQYQSEMNILVRNTRPDYQITPERTNGASAQTDVTEERINSEIEVLRSRDVADEVVDPAWNQARSHERSPQERKAHEKALLTFNKHLDITLLRKSNVIHVVYTDTNPSKAKDVVTRLLATFLAKQHDLERSSGASDFFTREQERYKRELDAAQKQLAAYQQTTHIVSLPDKEATLEQQIVELQQQLRTTEVQLSELSDRLASGQRELQSITQRQTTQQKTVPNILAMEQLTTMLAGYQNQKTALLTKYQPTDRLVQEVDQQIVNTSEALHKAADTKPSEDTTDVNPVWLQVKSMMLQNSLERSAMQARRKDQLAQLANLEASLASVEGSTVDFTTLQSKVNELQSNYLLYTQKRTEAQVANAMDQQQLVNVAIAEHPTFSATSSNPKLPLTLSIGFLAALILAMSAVFFSEMSRDTIASPAELEAISSIPVLATVPFIEADYQTPKVAADSSRSAATTRPPTGGRPPHPQYPPQRGVFTRVSSLVATNQGSTAGARAAPKLEATESRSP